MAMARNEDPSGAMESSPSQWKCSACTFLNARDLLSCEMCSTAIPAGERPPDAIYRDMLISDTPAGNNFGLDSHLGSSIVAEWMAAMEEEEERFRQLERRYNRIGHTTRGGGSGGHGAGGVGGGPSVSDAATGSAIGAVGAGLIAAMAPGNRRSSRVVSSMFQGALLGGVAGVTIGPELRRSTSDSSSRARESRAYHEAGDEISTQDLDLLAEYRRLVRQPPPATQRVPGVRRDNDGGGRSAAQNFEEVMLARHLRQMGILDPTISRHERRLLRARRGVGGGGGSQAPGRGSQPASAGTVSSLPEEVVDRVFLDRLPEDGRQCCICLENYCEREVVARLPCLHLYHANCIKSWLSTSSTCPQCKHSVN